MSSQTSAALDRLDEALTRLEADRDAGSGPNPTNGDADDETSAALAETEAMVEALRQDSMALMEQFQAQKRTTSQVAERLDALISQVRGVLGE